MSQLPSSPGRASLGADGSPCLPGVNEPVTAARRPVRRTALEPEQSLGPAPVEPALARTGHGATSCCAYLCRHRRRQGPPRRAPAPLGRGLRAQPRRSRFASPGRALGGPARSAGGPRSDRGLRGRGRRRAGRRRAAAGRGQPKADPRLRPGHRTPRQDRPPGCRGDRALCRGRPTGAAIAAERRRPSPRRAGRPPAPAGRDDHQRGPASPPGATRAWGAASRRI